MKKFESPKVDVVILEVKDIITTSGGGTSSCPTNNDLPCLAD